MCMFCLLVCLCTVCVQCLKPEEGSGSSGTGIIDGCELPFGYKEPNLCSLQEQEAFLTDESCLQPFLKCILFRTFFANVIYS